MAYDTRSRIHNLLSLIQAATNTEHLWKRHLLMKVDLKRVVFMGSWKGSPRLHSEYWFGLNGGRIWYKEWFGLLAMVLKRPRSARTLNGSIEVCVVGYTLPHNSLSSVITNQPASQAGNQPTRQPASQPTKSSSYIIRHQQDVRDDSCNNCWKHCTVQSVKRWSVTTERERARQSEWDLVVWEPMTRDRVTRRVCWWITDWQTECHNYRRQMSNFTLYSWHTSTVTESSFMAYDTCSRIHNLLSLIHTDTTY